MTSFVLDGIEIPIESGNGTQGQSYSPSMRHTDHKMGDSSIYRQTYAGSQQKLRTTIVGRDAWAPAALSGRDYTQPMELRCAAPRGLSSPTNQIALPTSRRTAEEFRPIGFAIVNRQMVETPASIENDIATLASVDGATGYEMHYWPVLMVYALFTEKGDAANATYYWTLECIEK